MNINIIKKPWHLLKNRAKDDWQAYIHAAKTHKWVIPVTICYFIVLFSSIGLLINKQLNDQSGGTTAGDKTSNDATEEEKKDGETKSDQEAKAGDKKAGAAGGSASAGGGDSSGTGGGGAAQAGPISAMSLTSGSKSKCNCSSAQTASIAPKGGGMLLVWVGNAIGGDGPSPASSVSGLGLSWSVVGYYQKGEGAPRGMTLLKANLPANPGSGPLTINYNIADGGGHWFWEVDWVSGTTINRVAARTDGGFLTNYSVNMSPPSAVGHIVVAGILVGERDTPVSPGAGIAKLGQSPTNIFATVTSGWTSSSRGVMDFNWSNAAHCMEVALDIS